MAKEKYTAEIILTGTIDEKIFACTCKSPKGIMIICIPKYSHPPEKWEIPAYRHRVKKTQIICDNFDSFGNIIISLQSLYEKWKEFKEQSKIG